LWGIPFGSSKEEVAAMVWQKTGRSLELGEGTMGKNEMVIADQVELELAGLEARVFFVFDDYDKLQYIVARCYFDGFPRMQIGYFSTKVDYEKRAGEIVEAYHTINQQIQKAFGPPQGGALMVRSASTKEYKDYDYPGGETGPDIELLMRLRSDDANDRVEVLTRYGNVFEMAQINDGGIVNAFRLFLYLAYFEDPQYYYTVENNVPNVDGFTQPMGSCGQ